MLEVQHLSVNYRGILALEDISLRLQPGELVGLIGPNGAGKSTLIQAILGLLPSQGVVLFEGQPLQRQRQRVAYVPQRSQIDWDYPITAWNVVMMAFAAGQGWLLGPTGQQRQAALEALAQVDLVALRDRPINQLSGGQQQRVFLARALAQKADLLLLDEPFAGIDPKTQQLFLQLLNGLKHQGKTVLVCNHDWGDTLKRYDRLLLLRRHLLADGQPEQVMTRENIYRAYGSSANDSLCTR